MTFQMLYEKAGAVGVFGGGFFAYFYYSKGD